MNIAVSINKELEFSLTKTLSEIELESKLLSLLSEDKGR
jgi:hypothetical protein